MKVKDFSLLYEAFLAGYKAAEKNEHDYLVEEGIKDGEYSFIEDPIWNASFYKSLAEFKLKYSNLDEQDRTILSDQSNIEQSVGNIIESEMAKDKDGQS